MVLYLSRDAHAIVDSSSTYRRSWLPLQRPQINVANISDNGLIMVPHVHNSVLSTEPFDNNLQIEFKK